MPTFSHDYLRKVSYEVFKAAGTPDQAAMEVAEGLISSNLAGHDSHGVGQVPVYVDRIKAGHIVPDAPFVVEHETPTTAVINGNWGFGFRRHQARNGDAHRESAGAEHRRGHHLPPEPHRPPHALRRYVRRAGPGSHYVHRLRPGPQGRRALRRAAAAASAPTPSASAFRRWRRAPCSSTWPAAPSPPTSWPSTAAATSPCPSAGSSTRTATRPPTPTPTTRAAKKLPSLCLPCRRRPRPTRATVSASWGRSSPASSPPSASASTRRASTTTAAHRRMAHRRLHGPGLVQAAGVGLQSPSSRRRRPRPAARASVPGEAEKNTEARLRAEGIEVEDSVWSDITGLIQEYELQFGHRRPLLALPCRRSPSASRPGRRSCAPRRAAGADPAGAHIVLEGRPHRWRPARPHRGPPRRHRPRGTLVMPSTER